MYYYFKNEHDTSMCINGEQSPKNILGKERCRMMCNDYTEKVLDDICLRIHIHIH